MHRLFCTCIYVYTHISVIYLLYTCIQTCTVYYIHVEYSLYYRALLQKRHVIRRSLLIVATPYISIIYMYINMHCLLYTFNTYGVATMNRLLKIIGLFCKRAIWKRRYSAKETCNFKEPNNRSQPIFMQRRVLGRNDTWLVYIRYFLKRHDSSIRETWLIYMRDMTCLHKSHERLSCRID